MVGGVGEDVLGETYTMEDGDKLVLGQDVVIRAVLTPAHTRHHMSYYITSLKAVAAAAADDDDDDDDNDNDNDNDDDNDSNSLSKSSVVDTLPPPPPSSSSPSSS